MQKGVLITNWYLDPFLYAQQQRTIKDLYPFMQFDI